MSCQDGSYVEVYIRNALIEIIRRDYFEAKLPAPINSSRGNRKGITWLRCFVGQLTRV